MLAREKSYNVSSAEGRKRGRKQSKTPSAYQHRCSGSPCQCCPQPMASGAVLRTSAFDTQEIQTKVKDRIEAFEKSADVASVTAITGDKNRKNYLAKQERLSASKEESTENASNQPSKKFVVDVPLNKKNRNIYKESAEVDEDQCVMCLKEKELESKKVVKTRATSIEQKIHKREFGAADNRVHRSKSDAQEKSLHENEPNDSVKPKSFSNVGMSTGSSKSVKRSLSFSRILNYSLLNRSKEYRL